MKMNLGSIVVGLFLRHRPAMGGGDEDGEGRGHCAGQKVIKEIQFRKESMGEKSKNKK